MPLSLSGKLTRILLGTLRPHTQAIESEERFAFRVPTEFPPIRSGSCPLQTPAQHTLFQNTALDKPTVSSDTASGPLVL